MNLPCKNCHEFTNLILVCTFLFTCCLRFMKTNHIATPCTKLMADEGRYWTFTRLLDGICIVRVMWVLNYYYYFSSPFPPIAFFLFFRPVFLMLFIDLLNFWVLGLVTCHNILSLLLFSILDIFLVLSPLLIFSLNFTLLRHKII